MGIGVSVGVGVCVGIGVAVGIGDGVGVEVDVDVIVGVGGCSVLLAAAQPANTRHTGIAISLITCPRIMLWSWIMFIGIPLTKNGIVWGCNYSDRKPMPGYGNLLMSC